jgi:hypothetical protein
MYNMDISIFGFKLNLEILILIGVVYLILVGHTLCGCCNYSLMEGLDTMDKDSEDRGEDDMSGNPTNANTNDNASMLTQVSTAPGLAAAGNMVAGAAKNGSSNPNGKAGKEGFVGANTNYGQSSPYDLTSDPIDHTINTSSWNAPNMTVIPGQPLSAGVRQFLAREPQPVPLPEGELDMFASTPFKPECCPNAYSNSTGCACMTGQQYNYLIARGGNNVPYSEY